MADIWHHNDDGIWCISCGEIIRAPWQSAPPPDECPTCGFPDDEMVAEYHAGEDVSEFEMLLACYRSGQVSERQWQGHLRDRAFREWVEDQLPINYPSACSGRDNTGQEAAMPDRIIMVRESEWREMREALEWYASEGEENAHYIVDANGERLARFAEFASRARAALAKSEAVP